MDGRARRVLGQAILLLAAGAAAVVLLEAVLMGGILLGEAFSERPLVGGLVLLLVGAVCGLAFAGSRPQVRPVAHFASRFLLLFLAMTAALLALEVLLVGLLGAAFSAADGTWREYVPALLGGLGLVLFVAACFKHGLGLRARYWLVALVVLALLLVVLVASQAGIFLG